MRADEVLPQPRGPENRYAWLMRPEFERRRQRLGDVFLADDLCERRRSVLAVESHGSRLPTRSDYFSGGSVSNCSAAEYSAQVASPSMASRRSERPGKVGAIRMFLSSGSFRYGNDAPAAVTAMPASLASATVRLAVPGSTSRLMK